MGLTGLLDPVFQKQTLKTAVTQMICSGSAPGEARRARERKKSGKDMLSREVPVCLEEELLVSWALILPTPVCLGLWPGEWEEEWKSFMYVLPSG